jgi:phospholipid/cholesterol/gamma-HCH transport system permease protein
MSDGENELPKRPIFFERIGEKVINFISVTLKDFLFLMSDVLFWTVLDLFKSKTRRKGELVNQAVLIGVKAVPIVGIMAFLIGLVLALQSAAQLRSFGANIFIVDLTVIAMMREMGPLITAILVAGRSGSAIAAEIATMKVTEELDALKTMALNPIRFIMVPKMQAGMITVPFLTIFANVMGVAGGMIIAFLILDITPVVFINRMGDSLYARDIATGILKSIIFAVIIVLIGCCFGSRVEKGAEGVGRVTTAAVVVAISLVILADSVLGLMFY